MEALDPVLMGVSILESLEIVHVVEPLMEMLDLILRGGINDGPLEIDSVTGYLRRSGDHGRVSSGEWLIPLLMCKRSSSYESINCPYEPIVLCQLSFGGLVSLDPRVSMVGSPNYLVMTLSGALISASMVFDRVRECSIRSR